MPGFGSIGAGAGPFGAGTPVSAEAPPDGPAGSRYINPATRDYAQDANTRQLQQMPRIRQAVLLAVLTERGSSSVLPDFGIKLPRKMGDTFDSEVRSAVSAALSHLTNTNRIRIDSVRTRRGLGGRAEIIVEYTDIESSIRDTVTI